MAAELCPGISISGMTSMWRADATPPPRGCPLACRSRHAGCRPPPFISAHLRQPRTRLNLDAHLVLGEVPMQHVHPVQGQRLDLLLHEATSQMAASVQTIHGARGPAHPRWTPGRTNPRRAPRFAFDRHLFAKGGPPPEGTGRCGGMTFMEERPSLRYPSTSQSWRPARRRGRSSTGSFGQGQTRPLEPASTARSAAHPSGQSTGDRRHAYVPSRIRPIGEGESTLGRPHRRSGPAQDSKKRRAKAGTSHPGIGSASCAQGRATA